MKLLSKISEYIFHEGHCSLLRLIVLGLLFQAGHPLITCGGGIYVNVV